jgi:hypothetical protein
MTSQASGVRVSLAPDGFYPQALQWQGGMLRVLCVEKFWTAGMQRRFRVRTSEGSFDLRLELGTGTWEICRRPGWLARARAHLAAQPRYPLPAGRRRAHLPLTVRPPLPAPTGEGGHHASRLALVRQ